MKKKIIAFILLATIMALAVVPYKAYSEKDKYSLNENAYTVHKTVAQIVYFELKIKRS